MKKFKFTLLFLVTAFVIQFSNAQCRPNGQGIELLSQYAVDSFVKNNSDCETIEGYITIDGQNITDLSGFSFLKHISDGNLIIKNTNISTIGFINLQSVDGDFMINNNNKLLEVKLNSLTHHDSRNEFTIIDNPKLEIIQANNLKEVFTLDINNNTRLVTISLNKLERIHDKLFINNNVNLTSIGLNKLDSESLRNIEITGNTKLSNCTSLCNLVYGSNYGSSIYNNSSGCNSVEEIQANCDFPCPAKDIVFTTQAEIDKYVKDYPNCTELSGSLNIKGGKITDISKLDKIKSTKGYIYIDNTNIKEINFKNLVDCTGGVNILENNALEKVDFSNMTVSDDLRFINNPNLIDISINKTSTTRYFHIVNNAKLKKISFSNLIRVSGNSKIIDNPKLTTINLKSLKSSVLFELNDNTSLLECDLSNFESTDGLNIFRNYTLKSLKLCKFVKAHDINIVLNTSLKVLCLDNLEYVFRKIYINESNIENLDFKNFTSFGGIEIVNNRNLKSLNFPKKLKTTGDINIYNNSSLKSLTLCRFNYANKISINNNTSLESICLNELRSARDLFINKSKLTNLNTLKNLTNIINLTLTNNPNLTDCSGLCNALRLGRVTSATIENNPSGCSNLGEADASCGSLAVDDNLVNSFTIYPNPTDGLLHVNDKLLNTKYIITDLMGRIIKKDRGQYLNSYL